MGEDLPSSRGSRQHTGKSASEKGRGDSVGPGLAVQAALRWRLIRKVPSGSEFSRFKTESCCSFLFLEIGVEDGRGEEPWPGQGRARTRICAASTLSWALCGHSLSRPRGATGLLFRGSRYGTVVLQAGPHPHPAARPVRKRRHRACGRPAHSIRRGALGLPTWGTAGTCKPVTGAAAVRGAGGDAIPSTPASSALGNSWKQHPPLARPGGRRGTGPRHGHLETSLSARGSSLPCVL